MLGFNPLSVTPLSAVAGIQLVSQAEAGTTIDSVSATLVTANQTITEVGTTSDSQNSANHAVGSVIEALSALDLPDSIQDTNQSQNDAGGASDASDATYITSIGEILAADDVTDAALSHNVGIVEVGTASDQPSVQLIANAIMLEVGTGLDIPIGTYITLTGVLELLNAIDLDVQLRLPSGITGNRIIEYTKKRIDIVNNPNVISIQKYRDISFTAGNKDKPSVTQEDENDRIVEVA